MSEAYPWVCNTSGFAKLKADNSMKFFFRRLVEIFKENNPLKDVVIDNYITELIIRLLLTKSKHHIVELSKTHSLNNGIKNALHYIGENIQERIEQIGDGGKRSYSYFAVPFLYVIQSLD